VPGVDLDGVPDLMFPWNIIGIIRVLVLPVVGELGGLALQAGVLLAAPDVVMVLEHDVVGALLVVLPGEAVAVDNVVVIFEIVELVP
jgi:hypothetical protein